MTKLGLLMDYPPIMELTLVWGVAISHCTVKVKINYENDPNELP